MVPPPGVQQLWEQSPHFSLSCESFENLFCEYFVKFPKNIVLYLLLPVHIKILLFQQSFDHLNLHYLHFKRTFLGQKYVLHDWLLFLPVGPSWRSSDRTCLIEHLMGRLMEPPLCSRPECSNVQLDPLYQFACSTDQLFYSFPCKGSPM